MRKYKPIELPLKPVPDDLVDEHAMCPSCRRRDPQPIGRLGLRLVFRCQPCRVNFHRPAPQVSLV